VGVSEALCGGGEGKAEGFLVIGWRKFGSTSLTNVVWTWSAGGRECCRFFCCDRGGMHLVKPIPQSPAARWSSPSAHFLADGRKQMGRAPSAAA
jgi:hypothetical protein